VAKKPRIRVRFRRLRRLKGERKVFGQAWSDGEIELHPDQSSQQLLDTVIHEVLHIVMPNASETAVSSAASVARQKLWELGYRRIYLR
jgi:hypothetical protein